jgi:hypothetical protein
VLAEIRTRDPGNQSQTCCQLSHPIALEKICLYKKGRSKVVKCVLGWVDGFNSGFKDSLHQSKNLVKNFKCKAE